MKGFLSILVAAAALAMVAAPAAWAHEEINPSSFPTGRPVFFLLNAANEQKVDLTKITIAAPQNLPFGGTTKQPAGWSADKSDTTITYSGPGIKPDSWDQWGFEIDAADQPGNFVYKVTLGFADGTTDDVSVPVTAVLPAAGAVGQGVSETATTAKGKPEPTVATTIAGGKPKPGGSGRANAALGLGAAAVVLSLIGIALAARRGSGTAGTGTPAAEQDF
jgi:opacity protein-like surface antigen